MYNKCDKCAKQLNNFEDRRLVLDSRGNVSTRCMNCYEDYMRIKKTA